MSNKHNEQDKEYQDYIASINSVVIHEEPAEYLVELGNISRLEALALMEMTHRGLISPSYSCYGFLLLKTLCDTDKQLRELFGNGTKLIKDAGVMSDEAIEKADKMASEAMIKIVNKINERNNTNNN